MRICGTIDFLELEELKELLSKLFAQTTVKHKVRIFGDEFRVFDDIYELHINTFDPKNKNPMKKPRFLIEGDIKLSIKESIIEFNRIIKFLEENKSIYCIAYYPNEEDDSEEVELVSSNYWETYEKMKIE